MKLETVSLPVKYRPKSLQTLVGQNHAVMQMNGMFEAGRIPSTILFTGPPGTGKTTTARILASLINCKDLKKGKKGWKACGECSSCAAGENSRDITELNAASSRGIDDVRALVENSKNSAFGGGKRIYILDEMHQFTPQATQLLLKPLEEPPPNTIWMLCSMSVDKIHNAIISRSLRLDMKPLVPETLIPHLAKVAGKEGVEMKDIPGGEKTLKLICELTSCHPRVALSNLDSLILAIKGGKNVDAKTVLNAYMASTDADIEKAGVKLICSVLKGDLKFIVKVIRETNNSRLLLNKAKWTISNLIDQEVGLAKYKSFGARLFEKYVKDNDIKEVTLKKLLALQLKLVNIEQSFMSNMDEEVLFMTGLIKPSGL